MVVGSQVTVAGTSRPAGSRSWTVVPLTVLGASGSLNVRVTLVPARTPGLPFAGSSTATVGGVVSRAADGSVLKTTSDPVVGLAEGLRREAGGPVPVDARSRRPSRPRGPSAAPFVTAAA